MGYRSPAIHRGDAYYVLYNGNKKYFKDMRPAKKFCDGQGGVFCEIFYNPCYGQPEKRWDNKAGFMWKK
jgi:hypothetical protein